MEEEKVLAELEAKGGTALKQIVMTRYKGKAYLQIRELWRREPEGNWQFGKKVISFSSGQFDKMMLQLKDEAITVAKIDELFSIFEAN